jgi:hypothetical protein
MRDDDEMRAAALVSFAAIACAQPPPPAPPVVTAEPVPPATAEPPTAPAAAASSNATAPPEERPADAPEPASERPERKPSAAEVQACTARGGTIEPVCMMGELACVVRYRDAGKRCSDKADCLGECLYEGDDSPQANAVGRCQRTSDPCGCKAPILRGRVQPALCAD